MRIMAVFLSRESETNSKSFISWIIKVLFNSMIVYLQLQYKLSANEALIPVN